MKKIGLKEILSFVSGGLALLAIIVLFLPVLVPNEGFEALGSVTGSQVFFGYSAEVAGETKKIFSFSVGMLIAFIGILGTIACALVPAITKKLNGLKVGAIVLGLVAAFFLLVPGTMANVCKNGSTKVVDVNAAYSLGIGAILGFALMLLSSMCSLVSYVLPKFEKFKLNEILITVASGLSFLALFMMFLPSMNIDINDEIYSVSGLQMLQGFGVDGTSYLGFALMIWITFILCAAAVVLNLIGYEGEKMNVKVAGVIVSIIAIIFFFLTVRFAYPTSAMKVILEDYYMEELATLSVGPIIGAVLMIGSAGCSTTVLVFDIIARRKLAKRS